MTFNGATPPRFSGRAGSKSSGRLRRALDGATDSDRRFGDSLEVGSDGRLEVRLAHGAPLRKTRRGIELDIEKLGEPNRPQLNLVRDLSSSATTADLIDKVNEMLSELRRTRHMKGGV